MDKTRQRGELTISVRTRKAKKQGGFSKDKAAAVPLQALEHLPDERDRRALPLLQAAATLTGSVVSGYQPFEQTDGYSYEGRFTAEAQIPVGMADELMVLLADTGRLFMRRELNGELMPATYDGEPAWEFVLVLTRTGAGAASEIAGMLQRGADSVPLSAPILMTAAGWVLFEGSVGRLRHFDAFSMLATLRADGKLALPAGDEDTFLARLYAQPTLPKLALPPDLSLAESLGTAKPHLKVGPPARRAGAGAASAASAASVRHPELA